MSEAVSRLVPNPLPRAWSAVATRPHWVLLGALIGLSLFLRLWGVNWDQGGLYHPDERAILLRVTEMSFPSSDLGSLFSVDSSWNPGWFPYGSLPLYMLKFAGYLAPPFLGDPGIDSLAVHGRIVSAIFDTLTVLLVYFIGTRFFGRWLGLLGAAIIGLSAIHIQQSHFFISDLMLVTFVMASFYFLSKASERGTYRWFILAAVFFGMALASKFSALPFAFVFAVAAAIWALPTNRREPILLVTAAVVFAGIAIGFSQPVFWALGVTGALAMLTWAAWHVLKEVRLNPEIVPRFLQALKFLFVSAGVTLVVFTILQPYAWIDIGTYLEDIGRESNMVRRGIDLPFTRQYIDTIPYLYHVQQLTLWGIGPPFGVLMWAGFAFSMLVALRRRDPRHMLMLAWVAPYFAVIGAFDVKFMRYMMPMTPLMALMGSSLAGEVLTRLKERRFPKIRFCWLLSPRLGYAALIIAFVLTLLYSIGYIRMYNDPHPATAAADWLRTNASSGSNVLKEHWEEGLGGFRNGLYSFRVDEAELYDDENASKRARMVKKLAAADYVVFYSNRLYGTIPRLPERYPETRAYYESLFLEDLGFKLVHWESSYPNIFGVSLEHDTFTRPDLAVPYALRDYKQTRVGIDLGFADESFTVYDHPLVLIFEKTLDLPQADQVAYYEVALPRAPEGEELLMLSETEASTNQNGGTWSRIFNRDSFVNTIPGVVWFLVVQLAFLVTLPLTMIVFRWLPDRGYFLGKTFSILLIAYIPWLLASLHWLSFSRFSVFSGLLLTGFVSSAIFWSRRAEIRDFLYRNRRLILTGEILFLLAFGGMYGLRLWNADLWAPFLGGEKPMDFAYFNAVVKSTYMPPYDPWYAGGQLNYYYFGFFINAALTKFTGIIPSIAINLVVPLFFALTISAAFSVVYNLAALAKRQLAHADRNIRLPSPILAGVIAGLFVAIVGNLDGIVQIGEGLARMVRGDPFGGFDFWRSSRMLGPEGEAGITEFPFFTFLFADPHAHLFVMPLTILAVGLVLSFITGAQKLRGMWGVMSWLPYISLGLTLGAIQATNSWDAPTYLLIGGAGILIAEYAARRSVTFGLIGWTVVKTLGVYAIGYVFFLPFQQNYEAFLPITDATELTSNRSVLWRYLGVHGFFIAIIVSYTCWRLWQHFREPVPLPQDPATLESRSEIGLLSTARSVGPWWAAYAGAYGILAVILISFGMATIAFLLGCLLGIGPLVWRALRRREAGMPIELMAYLLMTTPLVIGILVDVWEINLPLGRMNTVFKLYLQAWVLMALVAAFIVWRMDFGRCIPSIVLQRGWQTIGIVLVAIVSIYPILGTIDRSADRFSPISPTRDGMTFMNNAALYNYDVEAWTELRHERAALEWLQDNVQGSPVVIEGLGNAYRSLRSRVATYTGLPIVLGWDWHQEQQRCSIRAGDHCPRVQDFAVQQRAMDVDRFFQTTISEEALILIEKYNVSYIYVGDHERFLYPEQGISKLERMVDEGSLSLAYRNETVAIYRTASD